MQNLLAQTNPFGNVAPPATIANLGSVQGGGFGRFLQMILYVLIAAAGIYALINFILAGYAFLSAGDDPKKIEGAWGKIWQTIIGLVVVAGAFVIAALIGTLVFGNASFILSPTIPTI